MSPEHFVNFLQEIKVMTEKRYEEISVMVEKWEEKEIQRITERDGYCDTISPLLDVHPERPNYKEYWEKAAKEMEISFDELVLWNERFTEEAQNSNQEELDEEDIHPDHF